MTMTSAQTTQLYFDAQAARWDERCTPDHHKLSVILPLTGLKPSQRILDVACGTGALFPFLLAYTPEHLRAIDISPEMVKAARQKYASLQVQISVADFYAFEETGFDYLFVYNAYPHFLDKQAFGRKARHCLRPGGRLVIAHGSGRADINHRHSHPSLQSLSSPLGPCLEESRFFDRLFAVDIMVDTPQLYVLSGVRQ